MPLEIEIHYYLYIYDVFYLFLKNTFDKAKKLY